MYIYKIVNLVNDKMYIGQTDDLKRREIQHKNGFAQYPNNCMYKDMNEYGCNNFEFKMIDDSATTIGELCHLERYYINKYSLINEMYNVRLGVLGMKDAYTISKRLQDTLEPMVEIANEFFISIDSIRDLCKGKTYRFEKDFNYPIRTMNSKMVNKNFLESQILEIYNDLKTTKLMLVEIAKKYNVSKTLITQMNKGKVNRILNIDSYPIRKNIMIGKCNDIEVFKLLIEDIKNGVLTFSKIDEKYGLYKGNSSAINRGKRRTELTMSIFNNIQFPIRTGLSKKTNKTNKLNKEELLKIIDEIQNTNKSLTQIARDFGVTQSVTLNINKGNTKIYKDMLNIKSYPLR